MIKKSFIFLIGLFLIASFNMAQGVSDNPRIIPDTEETGASEPTAYINYIEGKALFKDFQDVELNMILQAGDEINTQDGRVEILLKGGGVIRLDRNTRVVFAVLTEKSIMLEIWSGNIYVKKGEMEIGVKSTNKSLNLSGDEWYFAEPEKSFKNSNHEREEELSYRADASYLPNGLERYDYALYRYGAWRYYAPYGNIWIPQVGFGWRPYVHGRWMWYPIIGWTWISYEPFGWCVYHYGRWQWDVGFGWYWIPRCGWNSAWVYWYNYGNYWGWCPRWHDSHYYQRHQERYADFSGNAWTTIHKDQLRSRDISRSIISKSELAKAPRISQNQLRTSPVSTSSASLQLQSSSTKTISRSSRNTYSQSPAPTRKIYSPDSRMSIQRKNPEPINSRRTSTLKRTDYSTRNTILTDRSYTPRPDVQSRMSPGISIRSFSSTSRSFSRPSFSLSRSFSSPRSSPSRSSGTIRRKK